MKSKNKAGNTRVKMSSALIICLSDNIISYLRRVRSGKRKKIHGGREF